MLDAQDACQNYYSIRNDAEPVHEQESRLGGVVRRLFHPVKGFLFEKTGLGYERAEILREIAIIDSIAGLLPCPGIVSYVDDGREIKLLTKEVPGKPLHEWASEKGPEFVLSVAARAFMAIIEVDVSSLRLQVGVDHEVEAIKGALKANRISRDRFLEYAGSPPDEVFSFLGPRLQLHSADVFSHGDFCLPNILCADSGEWSLIDLGKAGVGDAARDLSSMCGSVKRNFGEGAIGMFLSMAERRYDKISQIKFAEYDLLDYYWYSLER